MLRPGTRVSIAALAISLLAAACSGAQATPEPSAPPPTPVSPTTAPTANPARLYEPSTVRSATRWLAAYQKDIYSENTLLLH